MQTTPPYGYDEIVPLRKDHRVRFFEDSMPGFARKLNALAISLAEFTAAALGGDWDRSACYPAFVRRYPFCISKLYVDGQAQSERVVCVARS